MQSVSLPIVYEFYMPQLDIQQTIATAADSKLDKDYLSFFEIAKEREFFFNIRESDGQLTVPLVDIGNNMRAVVFYSSKATASRNGKFAGIVWEKGLQMVVQMRGADGLVIQNESESWIAITREKILELLGN